MPAAIRIDVHLFSIRAPNEGADAARARIERLATKLAQAVRDAMVEFVKTGDVRLETNSLDVNPSVVDGHSRILNVMMLPGLGPAYPPINKDTAGGSEEFGEGVDEYYELIQAGEDVCGFQSAENYDDGAFHVIVECDLGY